MKTIGLILSLWIHQPSQSLQTNEAWFSIVCLMGNTQCASFIADLSIDDKMKDLIFKVKKGMTKAEVKKILGTPDEQKETDLGKFNPAKAGQLQDIWTWRGTVNGKKTFIMLSFLKGKLDGGGTSGFEIGKGFHGKIPSGMSLKEKDELKGVLQKFGYSADD